MGKGSQAAMEFLMNYAIAIFVALVAIGALAYFGVARQGTILPSSCIVEPGIACVDFKILQDSVILVLRNGKGESLNITSIAVPGCQGISSGFLEDDKEETFIIGSCNFESKRKHSLNVNLTYISAAGLIHKKAGKVVGDVELNTPSNESNISGLGFENDPTGTLNTSLIAYWKLDEANGVRLDSKNNNDLTDSGSNVVNISGKRTGAANFTAWRQQYLGIPSNPDLSTGDINYTIAGWIYMETLGNQRFIAKYDGNGNDEFLIYYSIPASSLRYCAGTGGSSADCVSSSANISSGAWYFFAAWHEESTDKISIQVNGGDIWNASVNAAVVSADEIRLGSGSDGQEPMNGRIDEVGFWKKVLTSQERDALYNNGNANTYNS